MSFPLIYVKDVTKEYINDSTQTPVLRGVSFNIEKGEFVAIMGPSGSGKSTLLHMLGFLDRHTAGEYRFNGKTIDDYGKDEISHVRNQQMGFVFQAFNLLARTSVIENVKLPLIYAATPSSERQKKAIDVLESVGLSHRFDHEPNQLSGGEKQRVAIARALICNPNVIFADEPTGNLDTVSSKAIMEILENLNNKLGHTVILITHEPDIAQYAKRLIKIIDGKIVSDTRTR